MVGGRKQCPKHISSAIDALRMLTQVDLGNLLINKQRPPKPMETLSRIERHEVGYLVEEVLRLLDCSLIDGKDGLEVEFLALVLCRLGYPECIPGIMRVMDFSTFALCDMGDGRTTYVQFDPYEWIYTACAEALGKIGDMGVVPDLIRMVEDPEKIMIRPYACQALGLLRAQEARQALANALKDDNIDTGSLVRKNAKEALARLDRGTS